MLIREFGTQRVRHPAAVPGGPTTMTVTPCRPQQAWEALESFYESQQLSSRLVHDRELSALRMETGESIGSYWARAKSMRQKWISAGGEISSHMWMMKVIAGLSESWTMLQVVLNRQFSTLTEPELLVALTVEYERQVQASSSSAMWASGGANRGGGQSSKKSNGSSYKGGQGGKHAGGGKGSTKGKGKGRIQCLTGERKDLHRQGIVTAVM